MSGTRAINSVTEASGPSVLERKEVDLHGGLWRRTGLVDGWKAGFHDDSLAKEGHHRHGSGGG